MNRYLAIYHNRTDCPPGVHDMDKNVRHRRTEYTDIEIAATVRWLNERAKGYPTVYLLEPPEAVDSVV